MTDKYPKLKIHPLNNFLANTPAYTPFKAVENYTRQCYGYTTPFEIKGSTFSFHCDKEENVRTFELVPTTAVEEYFGHMRGDQIPDELFNKEGRLDYHHHFIAECKSCKEFQVNFLLHVYSDKPIPKDQSNRVRFDPETKEERAADDFETDRANIFIEKIGGPNVKITVKKSIEKYLDRESCHWFYKAKKALSDNLGIGAFAYFRRIIEKELVGIINNIAALPAADPALKELVLKYQNSSKPHLIYDDIFTYLPKSLQSLDANPLKLLYQQTSEGLHSLSETECLDRAKQIEILLDFVIVKINEEKSTMLDVKNAIKFLRNG
jgi:hypothetical protein